MKRLATIKKQENTMVALFLLDLASEGTDYLRLMTSLRISRAFGYAFPQSKTKNDGRKDDTPFITL